LKKYSYASFFRRKSTIVLGGVIALCGFFIKDLYAERTKDLATAIQSAKDGYQNEVHFGVLVRAIRSNFVLLEMIQRRIEENAPDLGHTYDRDLGETLNVYGNIRTELEQLAPLVARIPDNKEITDKLSALQNDMKTMGSHIGAPPSERYTFQDLRKALEKEQNELRAKSEETEAFVAEIFAKADAVKNRNERYHSFCQFAALVLFGIGLVLTIGSALSEARSA
jgi:hypothetical protein